MLKVIALLIFSLNLWAAEDHATVSLQRHHNKLIVSINHDAGWHTYWKNPGDSGLPSSFKFSQGGKSIEPKAYEWPVPTRHLEDGDILTIGYEGIKHFFFDDKKGAVNVHITLLICKDICIPGEAKLDLPAGSNFVSSRSSHMYSDQDLNSAFANLPKDHALPAGFEYYLTRTKGTNNLTLHYSLKGVKNSKLPHELNFLTGFPQVPFGFKREALFQKGDMLYGKTDIEWDGEYQEPAIPLKDSGEFAKTYGLRFLINTPTLGKVEVVTLNLKNYSNSSATLDDFYKKLPPMGKSMAAGTLAANDGTSEKTLLEYLLFAFLGGLILNLMPCVLPVISIKLFGLIKHKNTPRRKLIKHNMSYAAGVLSTFMVLAGVIVGLKAAGEEIGWGFQLQSPTFIAGMMLVLFILSMNMFGLFEFSTPGGSKFGGMQLQEGVIGDFLSGVLTTILSTPCSAPFLGTALTFAFTAPNSMVFIMFLAIGLGLAFPFILTGFFPQTLVIFPRPGAWMEKLKYFLGLSLLATVIWLNDVFLSLVDVESMGWRMNLLFGLWFFAFFFAKKISQKRGWQFFFFALPLCLTLFFAQAVKIKPADQAIMGLNTEWGAWSEKALHENTGKLVFMDFTAAWCLTCKVNKRLVLDTDSFRELKAKYNVVTLRADWTRRDDHITQFLKSFGIVGVPAYFVQRPDGKIISLGETVSISKIEENLK